MNRMQRLDAAFAKKEDELAKLRKQVERYREALEQIAESKVSQPPLVRDVPTKPSLQMWAIARAALKEE